MFRAGMLLTRLRWPPGSGRDQLRPATRQVMLPSLHPFHNLVDLVGNQTVRFAMHLLHRFFAGSFTETDDRACSLIKPVPQVPDPILLLHSQVFLVGFGHRLSITATSVQ